MKYILVLTLMTAVVFVAEGSARGSTSPGTLLLDSTAVTVSGQTSLPIMKGGKSLSETILPAAQEFTVAQLFVAATAADDEKNPPPRSTHCPPDKDNHHDTDQKTSDNQNKDNKENKDKAQHDDCGKGDDGKNP